MSEAQDQMKEALKKLIVPRLRASGFAGSFPHFRRLQPDRIDLLTFQFDRHGGGFVVEIGQCSKEGCTTHWGKKIAPEKIRAWDLSAKLRSRLQPLIGPGTESWFRYDEAKSSEDFMRTAESVLPCLEQAETMLADFQKAPKIS